MNKTVLIVVVISALILAGVGATLLLTGKVYENNEERNEVADETVYVDTQEEEQTEVTEAVPEEMTISKALNEIGATCDDLITKCTYNGVEYSVNIPTDWINEVSLRQQACDDGYVNANYVLISDGETWYISANYDEEREALKTALLATGLEVVDIKYCD